MFLYAYLSFLVFNQILLQLSNDPSLSSLPLLSTFLKSYSYTYLGLMPLSSKHTQEQSAMLNGVAHEASNNGNFPSLAKEEESLVEQDIRDRFKRMCEGYFENVSKKLVIEHKVSLYHVPSSPLTSCMTFYN